MLIQENFINYQGSRLHYAKAGDGPRPLLIFHGFGQDNQVFAQWVNALAKDYRLYVFDLYFHGQSTWPARQPLEKSDWQKILNQFFQLENISGFEVAGFSLGGKFALATLEAFSEKVKKVILLAPDGISTSIWYSLATYPIAIRLLFKSMVLRPGRYHSFVKFLRMLRLVNKGLLRFAESQMDTEEKRRRVYYSWVYFRHLKFDLDKIAAMLNKNQIPVLMVVGKFDKVIPAKNMARLLKRIHHKQFEVIESGHNDLVGNAVRYLTPELPHRNPSP